MKAVMILLTAVVAAICSAGPIKLDQGKVDAAVVAIKKNNSTSTRVPFAALLADYKAAKNTADREAVLEKVLAKLAGLEVIEADSKAKAKADAVKGRE